MKTEYDKGYWKKLVILKTDQHWNSNSQNRASSNNTRDDSTHGHHQKVNTEIKLIIFFAAKDGETLYGQQTQADCDSDHGSLIWSMAPYCQTQT